MPPPARYPLYADESAPTVAAEATRPKHAADDRPGLGLLSTRDGNPAEPTMPTHRSRRRTASWAPWAIAATFVTLIAVVGGYLLFHDTGNASSKPASDATAQVEGGDIAPGTSAKGASNGRSRQDRAAPGGASDLARDARASAPASAPDGVDSDDQRVTYRPSNLVDGDPTTAWRTVGDGTEMVLTFVLPAASRLSEVGLINGYAKEDWYLRNRRVLSVEWTFDDGTTVAQTLAERPTMQVVPVDAVETSTIELRIVNVSAPGTGSQGRDFTPISEISLIGQT